ncbi:hypothetical protein E3I90_02535 [Candidatus Bathyarchaeota archaeon]|nr:MAG: hypothetical protein E3I90_02535 [Candidatus Bathyarchaeota archaeon]
MAQRDERFRSSPQYFILTEYELLFLVICIVLDISEYMVTILLLPVIGDFLDVVGIIACFVMFRWVGLVSLFELVPGADILPIFIFTWLIWYFVRKREQRRKMI